jgi:hypothetical protein
MPDLTHTVKGYVRAVEYLEAANLTNILVQDRSTLERSFEFTLRGYPKLLLVGKEAKITLEVET